MKDYPDLYQPQTACAAAARFCRVALETTTSPARAPQGMSELHLRANDVGPDFGAVGGAATSAPSSAPC